MRENYYLLDDMEKYNKEFNRKDWEDVSVEDTIRAFKEIYKLLDIPIDVTTWIRLYHAEEKYLYAKAQEDQVCFIRDKICPLFYDMKYSNKVMQDPVAYNRYFTYIDNFCKVIGTHMSKSVVLPVYNFKSEKLGIEVTIRGNFYDYKVSIQSNNPINFDFMNLVDTKEQINPIYCEGMEALNKVFDCYNNNHKAFTFEITDEYNLYTLMFMLTHTLKNKEVNSVAKPAKW